MSECCYRCKPYSVGTLLGFATRCQASGESGGQSQVLFAPLSAMGECSSGNAGHPGFMSLLLDLLGAVVVSGVVANGSVSFPWPPKPISVESLVAEIKL